MSIRGIWLKLVIWLYWARGILGMLRLGLAIIDICWCCGQFVEGYMMIIYTDDECK